MKPRVFLASLAWLFSIQSASGHDPGLSYLKVCQAGATLVVHWSLHSNDVKPDDVVLTMAGESMEVANFTPPAGHEGEAIWRYVGIDQPYRVQLGSLPRLAFGHRVLAADCAGERRAVLSRTSQFWSSGD